MTQDCISYRIKNKLFGMLLSGFLSISWLLIFVECTKIIRGPNLLPREAFYNDPKSNDNFNSKNPHYIRVKKCENVEDNFLKSIEKIITESKDSGQLKEVANAVEIYMKSTIEQLMDQRKTKSHDQNGCINRLIHLMENLQGNSENLVRTL